MFKRKKQRTLHSTELKNKEAEFHDSFAQDYDKRTRLATRCPPPNTELKRHISSLLPNGSSIIEVGCGTGLNGQYLLEMGHRYIGLDISTGMLDQARRKLAQKGDADLILGDAENLPFKDASADVALGVAILHHLPSPELCVKELARCSKRWVIIAAEPTRVAVLLTYPVIMLARLLKVNPGESPADALRSAFSRGNIKRMAEEAGLEVIEIKPVAFINGALYFLKIGPRLPKPLDNCFNWIDSLLSHVPMVNSLAFHWNVYCRKRQA